MTTFDGTVGAVSLTKIFKIVWDLKFNPPTAAKFFSQIFSGNLDMLIIYDLKSICKYEFFDFSFGSYFFQYGLICQLSTYRGRVRMHHTV